MQPDEIDWKIINLLRESYQNNNAIARILGISEGTVRQRLKKLKELEIVKIKALINPEVLENQQLATVAVNVVESSQLESKAKEIAELPNVLDVSITSGRFDLFVQVLVDSNHGLVSFLTRELALVQGVSSTESFLMLKSFNKFV
ncbi:Lrp/AsnC family transcriptional regulator [Oceanispirochaeta sp.]|jgi:Lrp/AsnC family transcriptional regulator for asnA, asnC and gidA|uniref:Lrp/AsnC family transcriptional regulator n=1 Tax=Oceanispirochaeta sp. TaxID=2035350 RepID=UPI0026204D1A|nr:Lrp/AsnC family transcriptional regulator [Oceanispirochaeta sp.]MDA3956463.1 Lrp/AsnC family transcriptional regulator [Oceanispirochaeta sp.]